MPEQGRKPPTGLRPPPPQGGGVKSSFGGYKKQNLKEFSEHAEEVKALASGHDIVEHGAEAVEAEKRPAAFERQELQVVRSWVKRRPLEETAPASALIEYPRMWSTKRGRYSNFKLPGSGNYGLLRARPTW